MNEPAIPLLGLAANAYLLTGPEPVLIDPGAYRVMKIARKAETKNPGVSLARLAGVTATHWHVDHIGGLSEVLCRTRAEIHLCERIAYHLEGGKRIIYPPFRRFINMLRNRPDVKVTVPSLVDFFQMDVIGLPLQRGIKFPYKIKSYFRDGDALPHQPDWRVIETPGHTPDSVCFWHPKSATLVTGDTILGGLLGPAPNRFLWNEIEYSVSLERLKKLNVRRLLPGHGCVCEGEDLLAKL